MSHGIDYSKWDHIEGASSSDDEVDNEDEEAFERPTGPNVYIKSNDSIPIARQIKFGRGSGGGRATGTSPSSSSTAADGFKLAVGEEYPRPFSVPFAVGEMRGVAGDDDSLLPKGSKILIMSTQKRAVSLELCHGVWNNNRMSPSGHVNVNVQMNSEMHLRCGHDTITDDDWELMKTRAGPDAAQREKVACLRKAMRLCREAASLPPRTAGACKRIALVEEAIRTSGDTCAWAHYLRYEFLGVQSGKIHNIYPTGTLEKGKDVDKCLAALKESIAAGGALIELVNANELFLGKFYAWVPTRWLVRSLYTAACLRHLLGDLDEAERLFSECIGRDHEDHLGARNRQLLVCLDRGGGTGLGTKPMKRLLKARFGDDDVVDNVLAVQNYTRALHYFAAKGDRAKSREFLNHAISKNRHVPPVILGWEFPEPVQPLVELFARDEAAAYAEDCRVHWEGVTGAMSWLEKVYREQTQAGGDNFAVNDDMIRGTRLIVSVTSEFPSKSARKKEAILSDALVLLKSASKTLRQESSTLQYECFDRMATCAYFLDNYALTVVNCNLALSWDGMCLDKKKTLLYTRAESKEKLNDLDGALLDFKEVWNEIGHFSSAAQGIERVEAKLKTSDPFFTSWAPPPRATGHLQRERAKDDSIRNVEELYGEAPRPSQNAEDRCTSCARWGITLNKCSGCGLVSYCGTACQTKDWKVHRPMCKEARKKRDRD